jgi:hypothetical protein
MVWYKLEGQRFGKLVVIGFEKSIKVKHGTKKYWKCKCDCGNECSITANRLVVRKTRSCGCFKKEACKGRNKEKSALWKGGKVITSNGYIGIRDSENKRYILEHRLAMENHLGRPLKKTETVHHKNGNKADNHINNLELWESSHSSGQRVIDKIDYCVNFLKEYAPQYLNLDELN